MFLSREIATGYLDHWLLMGALLATYDSGYLYLVTVATHIDYIFHVLCNTMYSSKHNTKCRLFPIVLADGSELCRRITCYHYAGNIYDQPN